MKKLLILLFLSYVCSDKLDLTYLPPPGSQYSGGRPEDIQTPLEFPKHTYSSTLRSQSVTKGQGAIGPYEKPTIGINREVVPKGKPGFAAPGFREPLNQYQSSINPPSTTTSYAFSQTTTYPPSETHETTLSPIAGFPNSNNELTPPEVSGLGYNKNQVNKNRPGVFGSMQQTNQFDNQRPSNRPLTPDQQFVTKYGNQEPSVSTTASSVSRYPIKKSQRKPALVDQNPPQQSSVSDQFESGLVTGQFSRGPFGYNQVSNQTLNQSFPKRPTSTTSTPKGYMSSTLPDIYDTNNYERFTTIRPGIFQPRPTTQTPNEFYQPSSEFVPNEEDFSSGDQSLSRQGENQITDSSRIPQNQLKSTIENMSQKFSQTQYPIDDQQQYQESYNNKKLNGLSKAGPKDSYRYPSNTGGDRYSKPPKYKQDVVSSEKYFNRPARPNAELDRTAYIVNYDSVITPEGYAYSYDTSNSIHADESGSTIDGTKAKGSYSYTGDDGKFYSVMYTADENGFRPYGDHLPTPPPIPEAIQRIIEKVKEEKEVGIVDDGSYSEEKYGYRPYHGRPTQKPETPYYINGNVAQDNKQNYPFSVEQSENQQQGINNENSFKNNENTESGTVGRPYGESKPSSRNQFPGTKMDKMNVGISQGPKARPINGAALGQSNIEFEKNQSPLNDIQNRPYGKYPYSEYSNQEENDESSPVINDNTFQNRPTYENNDYQNKKENIPTKFNGMINEKQSFQRPLITKDDAGRPFNGDKNYRPDGKFSTNRPISKPTVKIDDVKRKNNDKLSSSTEPSMEYNTYYGSNEDSRDIYQSPVRAQIGRDKESSTHTSSNQLGTKPRRPYKPGLTVNENEGLVEDQNDYDINKYGTTPKYQIPNASYENGQQYMPSMKPAIFTTKYADAGAEYRPQGSDQTYYDGDNEGNISTVSTPSPSNRVNIKQQNQKTGYRYIPPRSMFYDEEDNKQLSVNRPMMLPRRPSQQFNYFENISTGKPKISTGKIPGDKYYEESFGPFGQGQKKVQPLEKAYDNNSPAQVSPDYKTLQQFPEYGASKGTLRPVQSDDDLYTTDRDNEDNVPFDRVSSTLTPSPTSSYYETTQMHIVPGKNLEGQNRPVYDFVSPSTPYPTPGYDNKLNDSILLTDTQAMELGDKAYKYGSRIPSTTYRPKYKILRNNTSSITPGTVVDRYGRPISSETLKDYEDEYTEFPNVAVSFENKNKGLRPTPAGERYQPTPENVRGKNPQLQYTTEKIIGEDFSGPKQPQRFDPETGYHYK